MERRVLLAVILSFLVLYGYQALFPTPPDKAKVPPPQAATQQAQSPVTQPAAVSPPATGQPASIPAPPVAAPGQPAGQDVTVDTPSVHAVFTTRAGALKSWRLKNYRDPAGEPLDLVATHAPASAPLPFTLASDDAAVSARLASGIYRPSATSLTVQRATSTLRFDYEDPGGLAAHKTFTFSADQPYTIDLAVAVTRNGQPVPTTVEWGPAIGSGIVLKSRTYNPPPQPVFTRDGKVTRVRVDKIAQQPIQDGSFGFAGVDDHYFLSALLDPKVPLRVQYQPVDAEVPGVPEGAHYVAWAATFPQSPLTARYFFGPKDFDVLAAVDRDLTHAIDFGWFGWLVVPLLRALKWVNGYVGNYGWSLIILTVLINLAMFPLRHKSVVSMRKMQEIQPEVKAIQDRYAKLKMSDPARSKMNTELMNLYRERGVNPASGCVPMLLTLPVLFAFYSMLSVAIELRGAPFIFWIHDLSAQDPYFVTPVLMGITMFIQQKMTPSTADPTQQKMFMIMPLVMMTMFLWAASGLVIYWTVSNVWGIAQQMITNRLIGPSQTRTVRPPAERRVKRAGGGSTDQASKERK
jgi:YidC/Oxa1 family membrane protein insertase